MARIRTVKPEFFRHERLYEAECETNLPLRIAFAGLWTAADREGRFRWSPRALKLDCLPYDDVDFSRVLDALTTRGFIIRYSVDGVEYGAVPSWQHHQVINNREAASEIPEPNETNTLTRDARVDHASPTPLVQVQVEGKGKEGKGKEGVPSADASGARTTEKKSRKGVATPLPDNYSLPPQISDYAASNGFSSTETMREHEKFRNHAKQNDRRCVDWVSAERNWLIGAAERMGKQPVQAPGVAASDGLIEVLGEEELQAWDDYGRKKSGKSFPRNSRGGWRFPSRWPPGYQPPERTFEKPPIHINSMQ